MDTGTEISKLGNKEKLLRWAPFIVGKIISFSLTINFSKNSMFFWVLNFDWLMQFLNMTILFEFKINKRFHI